MNIDARLLANHPKRMLKAIASARSQSRRNRKFFQQCHVFVGSLVINLFSLFICHDFNRPASALPLYSKLTTALEASTNTFCAAGGLDATATAQILTLIDLIPWSAILIVGSMVAWQAYTGYQAYIREDISGTGRCLIDVITLLSLTMMSSLITDCISS
jgi:hypothetical protein